MNFKPSDIYSLIITISLKKCIDASVNTCTAGGEGLGDNYVPNGCIFL